MQSFLLVVIGCVLWEAKGYPYYPYYTNFDSMALGATDNSRGGMVMSRYYSPYYNPQALGGGAAAFMYRPEEQAPTSQGQLYYMPDRRRQTSPDLNINLMPPQDNEVFPEKPVTEIIAVPTEKNYTPTTMKTIEIDVPTTVKTIEITEFEIEDLEPEQPKKRVSKKKQVQKPVEDEEEDSTPKMPMGAFFPMFFGWGGRSSEGGSPGPMAIANAYSTGRGGVATSHATAYGNPRPDFRSYKKQE